MDNLDNSAARRFQRLSGEWAASSLLSDAYAGTYVYALAASGPENARVRFLCATLPAGRYDVYAWWPAKADRATHVAYEVHQAAGVTVIRMDQTERGGQWNLLGTFDFEAGSHIVDVQNGESRPGAFVGADAVRFVAPPGTDIGR